MDFFFFFWCLFACACLCMNILYFCVCMFLYFDKVSCKSEKCEKSKQLFLIIPSISVTACKCSNEESQELCMPPAISMLRNSCSLSEPSSFLSSKSRTSSKVMILLKSRKCERMPFQALCSFLIFHLES